MIIIDAQNKTLGRVASAAAKALLGKGSATFAKQVVHSEEVKVINADQISISGAKADDKKYVRFSGYPGGQKFETYSHLVERRGHGEAIRRAVLGMLPKNKLQSRRIKNLIIEK
jgi:large subunit ribosomal protein L13